MRTGRRKTNEGNLLSEYKSARARYLQNRLNILLVISNEGVYTYVLFRI